MVFKHDLATLIQNSALIQPRNPIKIVPNATSQPNQNSALIQPLNPIKIVQPRNPIIIVPKYNLATQSKLCLNATLQPNHNCA